VKLCGPLCAMNVNCCFAILRRGFYLGLQYPLLAHCSFVQIIIQAIFN
jgi:hypothetical protein